MKDPGDAGAGLGAAFSYSLTLSPESAGPSTRTTLDQFAMKKILRAQSVRLTRRSFGRFPAFLTLIGLVATTAGIPARAQTVPVGIEAYSVAVNPVTNKIYVGDTPCSVIDGVTKTVTNLPNTATYFPMVVNSVANKIYFLNNLTQGLSVIDGATNTVTNISLGGLVPYVYAVNPVTNRIYVMTTGFSSVTLVIDGATNAIIANLPTGSEAIALDIDTVTNKIYESDEGAAFFVTVIDGATNAFTTINLKTLTLAQSVLVNSATNQVYLSSYPVTVLNGATNAVTTLSTPLANGSGYSAVALNPVTNTLYLCISVLGASAATAPGSLIEFNGFTGTSTVVPVGAEPDTIGVNPATNTIMVGNLASNTVSVINGATNATTTIPSPGGRLKWR